MMVSTDLLEFAVLLCLAVLLPLVPAYVLYKALPAKTRVEGPFRGLNIQLTGAFGAYFLVLLVVVGLVAARQAPARYQVWSVSGKVLLKGGEAGELVTHNDFIVQPPTTLLYPDGRFDLDVPVRLGQDRSPDFPVLVISHAGYQPQSVPLAEQQPSFGAKAYQLRSDERAKRRYIENPIELDPLPARSPP